MNTITKAAYEGDIVSRLRNWRGLHLAHSGRLYEEAADEIERLRGYRDVAEADRSVAMLAAERLRLTDEERGAVEWAAEMIPAMAHPSSCFAHIHAATLRKLLGRLGRERQRSAAPSAASRGYAVTAEEDAMTEYTNKKSEAKRDYEEGKLSCSLSFEIDGHKVSMTSGYDYETTDGLASMGWVWGQVVGAVLLSMRPHMSQDQWKDFIDGIESQFDEYDR